jgi:ABC-type antimicrobial peptide transport system permease subunit
VDPEAFRERGAFLFADTLEEEWAEDPWHILNRNEVEGAVPAVVDQATLVWALGKKLGDTLDYVDSMGNPFQIRLAASLKSSIFQGSIIISDEAFVQRFPSEEGYRVFLVDALEEDTQPLSQALSRAGRNLGLDVRETSHLLAGYYSVQNAYLSIFQILGGLGMLLGTAGLAVLVLRNVMERRSELAMLRALGFSRDSLTRLLLYEQGWLLALGLACGSAAAVIAVWPALHSVGGEIPYLSLAITLAVMAGGGLLWIWLAVKLASRGELLQALRHE